MSLEKDLHTRSNSTCELCASKENLRVYAVPPKADEIKDHNALICAVCEDQILNPDKTDATHWRCLNDSMWSEVPAVKVIAWRMLSRLRGEGWPQDLLDMLYLEDDDLKWAQ